MQTVAQFHGSIPRIYDRKLGPLLFEWSAALLAERVRTRAPGRLLEIACGTGIATEALRKALPRSVEICATDLNEAMLDAAAEYRGALPRVSYRVADAQALPFDDGSFDAVACQFGLMFFPDKVGAIREALRVLRPGGQLLFSTWDALDRNPAVRAAHETIAGFFPVDPPRFLETPFGLHEDAVLQELFRSAGARDVAIERCDHVATLPSARDPAQGLVCGTPGVFEIEARGAASLDEVVDAVEAAIARACGTDPVRAALRAIFVTASK